MPLHHEIRGKIINTTEKAVLFHRYGDAKPAWYPRTTVVEERYPDEAGSVVLVVQEWIFRKNCENARPGDFREHVPDVQPELPQQDDNIILDARCRRLCVDITTSPKHELRSNSALDLARILACRMNDNDLLELFDQAVSLLHERGVDIPSHYKGEQNEY